MERIKKISVGRDLLCFRNDSNKFTDSLFVKVKRLEPSIPNKKVV